MPQKKILILDGAGSEDTGLPPLLTLLNDTLVEQGADVRCISLRNIKINQCIGCFNCWLKTPGQCIYTTDSGTEILQNILKTDILIFFTPVVFGGYSSEMKKILERFLPIILPFFKNVSGETHHPRRYNTFPHIIGIGITPTYPTDDITFCFQKLVGRNAVNAGTNYSAGVFSQSDSFTSLKKRFLQLLSETHNLPRSNELNAITTAKKISPKISIGNRRALLIIGSPKTKMQSSSAVLGEYLLNQLAKHGWEVESLLLQENLLSPDQDQHVLLQAVNNADTILAAFPLYIDSLPTKMTKALEIISSREELFHRQKPKNFLAIINSGFPESYQSNIALSICYFFSQQCGMVWAGGLTFGAGEPLISGNPIKSFKGFRGTKRPPLFHVARSLNIVAAALAAGYSVPEKASHLLAKKPFPLLSFNLWRWFLIKITNNALTKEAKKNGITKEAMYSTPYESTLDKDEKEIKT